MFFGRVSLRISPLDSSLEPVNSSSELSTTRLTTAVLYRTLVFDLLGNLEESLYYVYDSLHEYCMHLACRAYNRCCVMSLGCSL